MDGAAQRDLDRAMACLADGDRSACSPVFSLLWPELTRFAERTLGAGPDADDAVQQAIEKVFAQAADYDPTRSALAWALAITAWECRTLLQRRRRKREEPLDHADELPAASLAPDDEVVHERMVSVMRECFAGLSTADQSTLEEAFFGDADGPRSTTFRKRKERALGRLRDAWRRIHGE